MYVHMYLGKVSKGNLQSEQLRTSINDLPQECECRL